MGFLSFGQEIYQPLQWLARFGTPERIFNVFNGLEFIRAKGFGGCPNGAGSLGHCMDRRCNGCRRAAMSRPSLAFEGW